MKTFLMLLGRFVSISSLLSICCFWKSFGFNVCFSMDVFFFLLSHSPTDWISWRSDSAWLYTWRDVVWCHRTGRQLGEADVQVCFIILKLIKRLLTWKTFNHFKFTRNIKFSHPSLRLYLSHSLLLPTSRAHIR